MKRLIRRNMWIFSFLVVACAGGQESAAPHPGINDEKAARLHSEFDFETFREHPEAGARIDFDHVDYPLLEAAVFHETNRVRAEHDLPALDYGEEVAEAARIQARGMAETETVSHEHADEDKRTLMDRLEYSGLEPAFGAENVAMTFGIQYESGRSVAPREEGGTTVFSYEPGGEPIEAHTYLSYAETLVEQWMGSPGHRENILSEVPEQLGTGHVHGVKEMGMDVFYSVQVFFKEL